MMTIMVMVEVAGVVMAAVAVEVQELCSFS
jgi:hypothetical protein